MLGQENVIVKQQIIKEFKQFSSRQQMIPLYMSYDNPPKQAASKRFWEELIENIIRKKNQIYINFNDLQAITTINGMKPSPLKSILKQLKKQAIFMKEIQMTHQRPPQKRPSTLQSVMSLVWNSNRNQDDNSFKYQLNQKIISIKFKERKSKQIIRILQKEFQHEHSKFLRNYIKEISWKTKIDQESVSLLFSQLKLKREIQLLNAQDIGDTVIIYCPDSKKMADKNFISVEKIKCMLRGTLNKFQKLYEKSSDKISNIKGKAKQALINQDKTNARNYLVQVKKQEEYRQNVRLRKQALEQKIAQIQLNEMNKSSIDLLQDAQKVYTQVAVDSQKMEEVLQRSRQIQIISQQANINFQRMADSQLITQEVDDLMRQLEMQAVQKNKQKIQPRSNRVEISSRKNQDIEIDKPYQLN